MLSRSKDRLEVTDSPLFKFTPQLNSLGSRLRARTYTMPVLSLAGRSLAKRHSRVRLSGVVAMEEGSTSPPSSLFVVPYPAILTA